LDPAGQDWVAGHEGALPPGRGGPTTSGLTDFASSPFYLPVRPGNAILSRWGTLGLFLLPHTIGAYSPLKLTGDSGNGSIKQDDRVRALSPWSHFEFRGMLKRGLACIQVPLTSDPNLCREPKWPKNSRRI